MRLSEGYDGEKKYLNRFEATLSFILLFDIATSLNAADPRLSLLNVVNIIT